MEMKKINSGKLRAVGYEARVWLQPVWPDEGSALHYGGEDSNYK